LELLELLPMQIWRRARGFQIRLFREGEGALKYDLSDADESSAARRQSGTHLQHGDQQTWLAAQFGPRAAGLDSPSAISQAQQCRLQSFVRAIEYPRMPRYGTTIPGEPARRVALHVHDERSGRRKELILLLARCDNVIEE